MPHVLIADDQPDVLEALRLLLKGEGYRIESAGSPAAILEAIDGDEFDAVLMDLNYARDTTSGQEGLDLISQLRAHDSTLPIVVMTAWGSVEVAVEAMRRGARDFVQKPWENARVLTIVRTQVELARALRRQQRLEAENRSLKPDIRPMLIAEAVSMRPVLELISRVGPSEANVLVTGENGTGKGTVAQALHAVSGRAGKGLVTVNAGGLSEGVFESELFGHVKGAFTDAKTDRVGRFELADGGTLFLDEIANVPVNLQPKLLRVLAQEVGGQRRNVLAAVAERRELDLDGVQAEQEILPEPPRGDFVAEVRVRGRHDAHVGLARPRRADALEVACFEDAQELRLQVERDVGDLVEEERAAVGQLEEAAPRRLRARERAFDVAEELARHELGRKRGQVLRDEARLAAVAPRVDLRGDELLAGARLAVEQDARVRARHR
ncbi:MAG TPA: sigma 54-interacting transcriptional regulator, partial [Vicinamibacterales bacterium]|nr:sigma 54-interacting transcriptional regulator [Vicinamibacterales bacterium]